MSIETGALLFGRFRILRFLGSGGVSEVYLAKDEEFGGELALKLIHARHARDPEVLSRFRREVEICRLVAHPSVAAIRELYEDAEAGLAGLAMEYLSGGDLESRIRRHGPLSESEIRKIGAEILGALGAAHAAGVIHRDVKPHNILFAASGEAKLADFGLARVGSLESARSGATAAGTPEYSPPECAAGRYVDGRGDLYSLGATLYEAAVGRPPFSANSPLALIARKCREEAPRVRDLRPAISEGMDAAIARALEADPELRFQTARDFAAALESASGSLAAIEVQAELALAVESSLPRCPSCGEILGASLPYCFRCRRSLPSIFGPRSRSSEAKVVVLGTGKAGNKLGSAERELCLSLVRRGELDSSALDKRIPRLPFILAKGLDPESAASLAEALNASGLPSAVSVRRKGNDRAIRAAFSRRIRVLAPRYMSIFAVGLMPQFNLFRRIFEGFGGSEGLGSPFGAIFGLLAVFILIPLGFASVQASTSYAKLKSGFRRRFAWSLLGTAKDLESASLQGLAIALGRKLDLLSGMLEREAALSDEEKRELASAVDGRLDQWGVIAAGAQGIERDLARSEREERRSFDSREAELELNGLYDRLLGFASSIDALNLRLASLAAAAKEDGLARLEREKEELSLSARAMRELESFLRGEAT